MGRICLVCSSPNRTQYEQMKTQQYKSIKDIWEFANKENREPLSYYSFQRHFQEHVESVLNEMKKASKLREEVLQQEIKKDIEISQQLTKNLELCADKVESMAKEPDLAPDDQKILLQYLGETRLIIEEMLKWSSKIQVEPKAENIFSRIIYCMKDFPEDLIVKFKERWDSFG